ncbi:MAG: AFG1 family ATPase [Gammaproteobacteria bacterium]|nr:AFG1 family ATPase [Gammaproteobacteria bacterium]
MNPLNFYQEQCNKGFIIPDARQLTVMQHLQEIYFHLIKERKKRRYFSAFLRKPKLVKGLYLCGNVGIGKTFLMDTFYHCLPFPEKKRMHFHQFMRFIHQQLKMNQGKKDPLQKIAKTLAQDTQVLCFDELFVADIADAMILGRLFKALFSVGICIMITSNVVPDDLYKNGLQRKQFLPAIDLLKRHTEVLQVDSLIDYRLRHNKNACAFYTPNDAFAHQEMEKYFSLLAQDKIISREPIIICERVIPVKKHTDNIVWFDCKTLCSSPRSQQDYLAIAEKYRTIFISDIPIIHAKDMITLFIHLIDVLYNAHVQLIFSSATTINKIYTHDYMQFEYARTSSRLIEMQSENYFLHTNNTR